MKSYSQITKLLFATALLPIAPMAFARPIETPAPNQCQQAASLAGTAADDYAKLSSECEILYNNTVPVPGTVVGGASIQYPEKLAEIALIFNKAMGIAYEACPPNERSLLDEIRNDFANMQKAVPDSYCR